jgi:3-oxoacyl-[acyl-carrier protein] reductase
MAVKPFEDILVGDTATVHRRIDQADVTRFAELTGDTNPLHVDRAYAEATPFRDIVVHGMLGASLLSTVIGTRLPGEGALWVSQSFEFRSPVRLGDELAVTATVTATHPTQRLLDLDASISNQRGEVVLTGTGRVQVLEQAVATPPPVGPAPVAIVTGGSGGIGAAICRALAATGHAVVVGYHTDAERAGRTVAEITEAGGRATAVAADLSLAGAGSRLVEAAVRSYGDVGVVVHNASDRIGSRPIADVRWEDMAAQLDVQLRAAFELGQAAIPLMRARGDGRIIHVTSQVVDVPVVGWTAYAVAKSALGTLARQLAEELGPDGITVNCVAPGLTETRLVGDLGERARLVAARQTPLRRLAVPDDVAGAVAFLASPAGAFMSGQTLRVNGGRVMA